MKMYSSQSNKKYWDQWNIRYSDVWKTTARQIMSKKETDLISAELKKHKPLSILDIGIGNGRILDILNRNSNAKAKIYGIDISGEMVKICQSKFKNYHKITNLKICDLSSQELPFKNKFDFATSIRVLKYNANWKKMIKRVFNSLNPEGVFIFTMPNKLSVSGLSGDTFSDNNSPIIYSNILELKKVTSDTGFSGFEVLAFSKLPNFLYHMSNNRFFVKLLLSTETVLEKILGQSLFGRELFVICAR